MPDKKTLYEIIKEQMFSDDENPEKISEELIAQWEKIDTQKKAMMDSIFITLTGWSFQTLLRMYKEQFQDPITENLKNKVWNTYWDNLKSSLWDAIDKK